VSAYGFLFHCLRPGHTRSILARDPYAFLLSLGFQLRDRYGDELFPEAVSIDVDVRARSIAETGVVTGAEIQRLVAVPWRSAALRVSVHADDVDGKVSGVRIAEVADDYRQIPLTAFRSMALLDPLRRLGELHPDARVVLWIDALDEDADAGASMGDGIASVLPGPGDLVQIGNLALVISARASPVLDRFTCGGAHVIAIEDARFVSDTAALVATYIARELAEPEVDAALRRAGLSADSVGVAVSTSCAGNLLYLRQFFIAVREGKASGLMAGNVPFGLDAIYVHLLGDLAAAAGPSFVDLEFALLQCLAVALRPMKLSELAAFTRISPERVKAALTTRMRPYLDNHAADPTPAFALYHSSFRDCLMDPSHEKELWHVSAASAHGRIARHYLEEGARGWDLLDDYGLDHVVHHTAHATQAQRARIADLVAKPLRLAQRHRHGSNVRFAEDLGTAARAIRPSEWSTPVGEVARLAFMAARVAEAGERLPPSAVTLLVRLGTPQRALAPIRADLDVARATQLRAAAIAGFAQLGEGGQALVARLLIDGLAHLARVRDEDTHHLFGVLLAPCPPDVVVGVPEAINGMADVFKAGRRYWATPRALIEMARVLSVADPGAARRMFREATVSIPRFCRSSTPLEQARLLRALAAFDVQEAIDVLTHTELRADESTVEAVLAVARALYLSNPAGAESLYQQVKDHAQQYQNPYDRALGLAAIAAYEHELGLENAAATVRAARVTAEGMCGPGHPRESVDDCRRHRTSALARVATVLGRIEPTGGADLLEEAWASLEQHGNFDPDTIDDIVTEQLRQDPDLLDVHVAAVTRSGLRAELLMAQARALMAAARWQPAKRTLEAAILTSELAPNERRASATAGGPGRNVPVSPELALATARVLSRENPLAAASLVDETLDPDTSVRWRLDVLGGMLDRGDALAAEWWQTTLSVWIARADNPNFIVELPAFVRRLPDPLFEVTRARMAEITRGVKRRWLEVAASARLAVQGRGSGKALLDTALAGAIDNATPENPTLALDLNAFAAGQWERVDGVTAEACWQAAMREAGRLGSSGDHRQYLVDRATDLMGRGAPAQAIESFRSTKGRLASSGQELTIVVPGAGVPVPRAAGVSVREYALGLQIGQEAARMADPAARAELLATAPPVSRALATVQLAREARQATLKERLDWCGVAAAAARAMPEHHLRCLFLAESALAYRVVGAGAKALALARETADDIVANGRAFGAVHRKPAYGYAFGVCVGILSAHEGSLDDALALLWEGRRLDGAFSDVIVAMVSITGVANARELGRFAEAERDALALFS
jgi:hypothetical protein